MQQFSVLVANGIPHNIRIRVVVGIDVIKISHHIRHTLPEHYHGQTLALFKGGGVVV
jgi:hypothetical protein